MTLPSLSVDLLPGDPAGFRAELREWLAANVTDEFPVTGPRDVTGADGAEFDLRRAWQRRLYDGGWAGVHWPVEHGGRSAGLLEYATYLIECGAAGAPEPVNTIGLNMIGPSLIAHGSPEQHKHLDGILSAEFIWSQLFSEPDAGSDLGSIRTKVRRTASGWRVDGQKTWISFGPRADYGFLLARTGPAERSFAGLSCFIVDLHGPGVTIRPIVQMSGEQFFADVFFDGVDLSPEDLVGAEGEGWKVALTTLQHERTTAILSRHAGTVAAAGALVALAGRPGTPRIHRDAAVALWGEVQLFRLNGYRGVVDAARGRLLNPASASQRLQWALLNRRIHELAQTMLGADGLLSDSPDDSTVATWTRLFCASRGWTVGGGTSEIQRNMLAEQVLQLPRIKS